VQFFVEQVPNRWEVTSARDCLPWTAPQIILGTTAKHDDVAVTAVEASSLATTEANIEVHINRFGALSSEGVYFNRIDTKIDVPTTRIYTQIGWNVPRKPLSRDERIRTISILERLEK